MQVNLADSIVSQANRAIIKSMLTVTTKLARDVSRPLSDNKHLLRWVEKMVELTQPANIHWVDGSQEEYDVLCGQMVEGGTFIKLNEKLWPGCFYARSDASDVAPRRRTPLLPLPLAN